MELPVWLKENDSLVKNNAGVKYRKKIRKNFIQKTLQDIVGFLQSSVFSEKVAAQKGFLQSLDPRMKFFALFFLLIVINLISHLGLIWGFYVVLLVAAAFSGISPIFILKRVWLVVPLFTGIMVLPALFNWVRPGDPVLFLWKFSSPVVIGPLSFPENLFITRQGLWGAVLLISRVGISVSLAAILTLTTRWNELLRALRVLLVPKIFVATLEMTYRYIFVLITILEEMFTARKARDAGQSSGTEQRRFVASSMASLFGKSLQMSEEVYSSMAARGYTGEIRTMQRFRFRLMDAYVFAVILLSGFILFVSDKVLGG